METQTETSGKGKGFPKSPTNPGGYTMKENDRRLPPKERESKRGNGRKDKDGTAEIVKFESITKGCSEMMKAYKKLELAKDDYNATVKAVAERSNSNVTTLKKLVRSSAKGNFQDVKDKLDQEQEVFDMVGEIGSGKESEAA